ncbi:MAG TPA: aldo/keto reductase [Acidimicrobiales bacterium]|nr:aldo/keto reductase [Acidimicrobiales bacterium]
MQTRRLGRTGHHSSVAICGGIAFHFTESREEADALLDRFLDAGVNHLDIAPQYGTAQQKAGAVLGRARDAMFVACKTLRKNRDGVRAQLEESLTLLGCDHFDLYQLHAVTSVAELDARAEAMAAVMQARDEGLCRFVGVTGHDLGAPAAHAEAIRRYDVDTVMFPVFPRVWSEVAYRRDADALLALATERDVGVMAIKAVAARPWGERDHTATTWYEPYEASAAVTRGVRFALSTPPVTGFCTPGDLRVLQTALDAAESFEPLDEPGRRAAIEEVAGEPLIFPMATATA